MKHARNLVLICTLAAAAFAVPAAEHGEHAPAMRGMLPKPPLAVNVAFDRAGRLWRVRAASDGVWVDHSDDRGASFVDAVRASPEVPSADGELAPEIAAASDGTLHVAYTLPGAPGTFAGDIRITRSADGGRSFAAPDAVNDNRDPITHRFQSLALDANGIAHLVWIDKRDGEAAKRRGAAYAGAAIYAARVQDGRVGANVKVADHSCECCRISTALDTDGVPLAFWRQVFADGSRDHALARLDGSAAVRATFEGWRIGACPHHGPALAVGADGTRHLAWFTGAQGEARVLYQARDAAGKALAPPRRLGSEQAGYPALLAQGRQVVLAWKEFDGRATRLFVQCSRDSGRSFGAARALASSSGPSDRPRLAADGEKIYLSWNTKDEGYRLIPVPDAP